MARYGRRQRRRGRQQNSRVNSTLVISIVLIAVLAGYLTTRFVIYPLLLQEEPRFSQGNGEKDKVKTEDGGQIQGQTGGDEDQSGVISDGLDVKDAAEVKAGGGDTGAAATGSGSADTAEEQPVDAGFCIQFGSFSTQAAAENLVSQLSLSGVGAKVVEKDGAFKVIGDLFTEKTQAVAAMEALDSTLFTDVFITSM